MTPPNKESRFSVGYDAATERPLARPTKDERRRIILDRAARLFEQNGFESTSMQEIADEVGLAKAALYYYFTNKQEILYEIHDAFVTHLSEKAQAFISETSDPSQQLRFFVHSVVGVVAEFQHYVRVFHEESHHLSPKDLESIHGKRAMYAGLVESCIARGIAGGQFRAEISPRLATLFIFGAINWTYQWLRSSGPSTPEQIADYFYDMIMSGIATECDRSDAGRESPPLG